MTCLCEWSTVNTRTEDPPHITWRNPACPLHGVCDRCGEDLEDAECP